MAATSDGVSLEEQIDRWRSYVLRARAKQPVDIDELERRLRKHVSELLAAGLAADEAFLIALKRIGAAEVLSRRFASEHAEPFCKPFIFPSPSAPVAAHVSTDAIVAFCLAVAAAVLVQLPTLFGLTLAENPGFYARNASFFVLPLLTAYFVWKRRLGARTAGALAAAFLAAVVLVNAHRFAHSADTERLVALHLPIALWLAVGIAYAGTGWAEVSGRMDFVRFSGELLIYYVLIALGGGVLTAFMAMIFHAIGFDLEPLFESWLLPGGAAGAVLIASWLVEAKQGALENMAGVLARIFSPLFAAMLLVFLGTVLWTGQGVDVERNVLIAFDLLLVAVLGLLLYAVAARDPRSPPGAFDVVQTVLALSAVVANAVALYAIVARIDELGFTPNRVAALGENAILLVNLAGSAVLYLRFLAGRASFAQIERWQTAYIPVYAVWAAFVVIVFPPLFGYR